MGPVDRRDILELARIWAPYGGAPAGEILVRFGISRPDFYKRVLHALPGCTDFFLSEEEARAVRDVALRFVSI